MPKGIVRFLLILLLAVAAVGIYVYQDFQSWSDTPLGEQQSVTVEFASGSSLATLVAQLHSLQVITEQNEVWYLQILGRTMGIAANLQAGEYQVLGQHTPRQVLSMIAAGRVRTYEVVIADGTTTASVLSQLQADPRLEHLAVDTTAAELEGLLDFKLPFVEGAFLPETYQIRRGDGVITVLQRAHKDLILALDQAWAERDFDSPITSREELLILASIIEKETGLDADRAQISQVFHLRLKKKMRMQTDPTVIYAMGDAFDGNIRRRDLQIDSPYNTYRVFGLPPTPIALPSRLALEAAAKPATGDYLYFVARGDGSSQFSRTLDEHNRAVRRYQMPGG